MKPWILTLALALAISFTTTPAHAGLDNREICESGKLLAAAKFSQCRIKVDFLAVKKGEKLSAEKKLKLQTKCATKLTDAYAKLENKYPEGSGPPPRVCRTYGDAEKVIEALVVVGDAVADGSISTGGADALATSDNQAVCEAAGGTWENNGCVAGTSYNCMIGGMCSAWAANFPEDLSSYTNSYVGDNDWDTGCDESASLYEEWTKGVSVAEVILSAESKDRGLYLLCQ